MNNYSVYIHTNLLNNKKYVGLTKQPVEKRWGKGGNNYSGSPRFFSAIQKYGWDNFKHEVIESNLSREDACNLEKELIKNLKTQESEFGYNISEGGDAPKLSESSKELISLKLRGNKNGLNKECSEEKRKKISDALKGRKFSETRKQNLSRAKKGKSHKPLSKESRLKIAEKHKKSKVYCKELDKVFSSIHECARETGAIATNICKCCKGKIKSTCGMHFSYYNTDNNSNTI